MPHGPISRPRHAPPTGSRGVVPVARDACRIRGAGTGKLEREHDDHHDERFGGIVAARAIG